MANSAKSVQDGLSSLYPGGAPVVAMGILVSGKVWLLSSTYMFWANPHCLRLFRQVVRLAFSFALARAGRSSEARIAMMAITTSNSMSVKPRRADFLFQGFRMQTFPNMRRPCPQSVTDRWLCCYDCVTRPQKSYEYFFIFLSRDCNEADILPFHANGYSPPI